jgi:lysophospholipase L1-like esterase
MQPSFRSLVPLCLLVGSLACASAGTSSTSGSPSPALGANGASCPRDADWSPAPVVTPLPEAPTAQQLAGIERTRNDWANLARYRDANAALGAPAPGETRVVFMGNSITDAWAKSFPAMFPGKPYVGRGISGQTTPQMLVRFRQDVIALRPKVVVILAGINDIAGNTGPSTQAMIADNLMSMTEIAKANGIRVVLSSVLPAYDFPWRRGLEPAPKVVALNAWLKCYAAQAGAVYLDYYSKLVDARGGLSAEMASDGVHPTEAGYRIMAPLAEAAIQEALRR